MVQWLGMLLAEASKVAPIWTKTSEDDRYIPLYG